ncbi:MAG: sulfotransferase [Chloroflexota bacterium]
MHFLNQIKKSVRSIFNGDNRLIKRNNIPAISADEVIEARQFFQREKFFILGHARSGTTLLARLVRLHPEVHCNWQAHFFTREPFLKSLVSNPETAEWLGRKSNRWNLGRDLSPLIMRVSADFILERDAAREKKRIVGDKSPSSLIHGQAVRDMAAIYPDASLVYIVRDGRDVLISERFRNFIEDSKFLSVEDKRIIEDLKRDQKPFLDGSRSIFTDTFLRRAAAGWAANLQETDEEASRLYEKKYLAIRYEDLLSKPYPEMNKLWRFLGAYEDSSLEQAITLELTSNPDEEWQAKRNDSIASFLPKGKAGNWHNIFTMHDRQIFKETAGEMLIKWNYEKDLNW